MLKDINRKWFSFVVRGLKIVILLLIIMDTIIATSFTSINESLQNQGNTAENIILYLGETNGNNGSASFNDPLEVEYFEQFESNESIAETSTKHGSHLALAAFYRNIDPAFVALINPFWLKFNPPPAKAHYILGTIHTSIMVIGLFGNALVIFMFVRCRSIRTPCNTLVINLAISDFLMLAKAPIVIYNSFKLGPALGDYVCRLYGFVGGLTGTASIATLTAISIDRYNVVVYPLQPLRSTTRHRCYIMVLFVWIYSFTFSIVPALNIGFSKYVPEGFLTSCSFDYLDKTRDARIFMFVFFIFAWFIPFVIITYCYTHILKVVILSRNIRSSKDKNKTEIKLSIIVIGVILLWFAAWTPYSIVALLGISGNEDKITPLGSMIPAVFCKASACIDPYVYSITHPRFRMEFGRLFFGREKFYKSRASYTKSCNLSKRNHVTEVDRNLKNTLKIKKSMSQLRRETIQLKHFKEQTVQTDILTVIESFADETNVVNVVKQ